MIKDYIKATTVFPLNDEMPWTVIGHLGETVTGLQETLGDGFVVKDGVAIHKTAVVGHNVTIKAPAIICENCFVGSNSYLRGGIFLAPGARVGDHCRIGANAVLTPGTLLEPHTIVKRLELVEQDPL